MPNLRLLSLLALAASLIFSAFHSAAADPVACYPGGIRQNGVAGDPPVNSSYFRATHINATPRDRSVHTTDVTLWRVRCTEFGDTPVVALKLKPFNIATPLAPPPHAPVMSVRQNGLILGSFGARHRSGPNDLIVGFENGFRWTGYWTPSFFPNEVYYIPPYLAAATPIIPNPGVQFDAAAAFLAATTPLIPNAGVQFDAAAAFELVFGENADSPDYVAHVPAENQPANMLLSVDVKGYWWNPQQPGWGLGLDRNEAGTVFGVWNTYDENNRPIAFVMSNGANAGINRVSGAAYLVTGPFYGQPFDHKAVRAGDPVGKFTIQFNDDTTGTFDWSIGEKSGSTPLTRFIAGPRTRIIDYYRDRRGAWWNMNESGWGMMIDHGDERPSVASDGLPYLFAVWYVYGEDGKMTWFVAPDTRKVFNGGPYQPWIGPIYWPRGSYYGAPYEPGRFNVGESVGTLEMREALVFYQDPATGGSTSYTSPVSFNWKIDVGAGTFSGTKQYMPFRY